MGDVALVGREADDYAQISGAKCLDERKSNCRWTCGRETVDGLGVVHSFQRNRERNGRFGAFWGSERRYLVPRFSGENADFVLGNQWIEPMPAGMKRHPPAGRVVEEE